ncbi:hypothetical protein NHX12_012054, partial [Muraenolepis orangiensis]
IGGARKHLLHARTPAELAFGRPPDPLPLAPGPEYASRLLDRLESAHAFAHDHQLLVILVSGEREAPPSRAPSAGSPPDLAGPPVRPGTRSTRRRRPPERFGDFRGFGVLEGY